MVTQRSSPGCLQKLLFFNLPEFTHVSFSAADATDMKQQTDKTHKKPSTQNKTTKPPQNIAAIPYHVQFLVLVA